MGDHPVTRGLEMRQPLWNSVPGRACCFRNLVILLVVHILTLVLCLSVSNLGFVHLAIGVPHKLQPPREENMQPLAIFYQMTRSATLTSSVF